MIAGVVLAAGTSSRLGRAKQLLSLRGRPLLQHVVDAARAAGLDEIVVVLGHMAEEIRARVPLEPPARPVVNPDYRLGQSASLRAGLHALGPQVRAAVILLGDQPGIHPDSIRKVVTEYERRGCHTVRASYRGQPGHPVLFDRAVWRHLEALEGDVGARQLLSPRSSSVVRVEMDMDAPTDIDTVGDYESLVGPLTT